MVVRDVIREASKQREIAYSYKDEIFYNKEPVRIEDESILAITTGLSLSGRGRS